jgi:hypothetical protein
VVADLDKAVQRLPVVIAVLGLAGSIVMWQIGGVAYAVAFLVGAIAAWFNFQLVERFVSRLAKAVVAQPQKRPKAPGLSLFLQLALFILGAFVIIRFSGFNLAAALAGFLVCPAAVMLEAIWYLILWSLTKPG